MMQIYIYIIISYRFVCVHAKKYVPECSQLAITMFYKPLLCLTESTQGNTFCIYTQKSVKNINIYINLHHIGLRGHRGQLQFSRGHLR